MRRVRRRPPGRSRFTCAAAGTSWPNRWNSPRRTQVPRSGPSSGAPIKMRNPWSAAGRWSRAGAGMTSKLWAADVPWVRERGRPFYQLFVNGQRRVRARMPNEGSYFYTKRLRLTNAVHPVCLGMTYHESDLAPLQDTAHATVVLFHNWVNSFNCIGQAGTRAAPHHVRAAGGRVLPRPGGAVLRRRRAGGAGRARRVASRRRPRHALLLSAARRRDGTRRSHRAAFDDAVGDVPRHGGDRAVCRAPCLPRHLVPARRRGPEPGLPAQRAGSAHAEGRLVRHRPAARDHRGLRVHAARRARHLAARRLRRERHPAVSLPRSGRRWRVSVRGQRRPAPRTGT